MGHRVACTRAFHLLSLTLYFHPPLLFHRSQPVRFHLTRKQRWMPGHGLQACRVTCNRGPSLLAPIGALKKTIRASDKRRAMPSKHITWDSTCRGAC